MWGLLAGIAAQGFNLWQKKEAMDDAAADYNRRVQVNKALAAEQLAITYNSIARASMEVNAMAYRKEAEIRTKQRQAEGAVAVQAAKAGAVGRRAQLAQKQATVIPTEREIVALETDRSREQDNLIARADMEERKTINNLISHMPDVPNTDISGDIAGFVSGSFDAYSQFKKNKKTQEDAIVLGSWDVDY